MAGLSHHAPAALRVGEAGAGVRAEVLARSVDLSAPAPRIEALAHAGELSVQVPDLQELSELREDKLHGLAWRAQIISRTVNY